MQINLARMNVTLRNIVIFVGAVILNQYAAIASFLVGGGLDFKNDAKEVSIRLEIVSPRKHLDFGEIDYTGYETLLSRISQVRHLRDLSIIFLNVPYDGFVFDCERLAGLTNLTRLCIANYGTNSVKVTSLCVCKESTLRELLLQYVDVDEVDVISEFMGLEDLYCTTEALVRCAPRGLRTLYVEDAEFKGSIDLNRFSAIETLGLLNVKCMSIKGLNSLTALESLQLVGVPIKNLSDIKWCSRLKSLEICNCRELDGKFNVADFKNLPLEHLVLENVHLKCIQNIEESPLRNLRINDAEIDSISNICTLINLERLDVSRTKIHSVDNKYVKECFPKLKSLIYYDQEHNIQCVEWD